MVAQFLPAGIDVVGDGSERLVEFVRESRCQLSERAAPRRLHDRQPELGLLPLRLLLRRDGGAFAVQAVEREQRAAHDAQRLPVIVRKGLAAPFPFLAPQGERASWRKPDRPVGALPFHLVRLAGPADRLLVFLAKEDQVILSVVGQLKIGRSRSPRLIGISQSQQRPELLHGGDPVARHVLERRKASFDPRHPAEPGSGGPSRTSSMPAASTCSISSSACSATTSCTARPAAALRSIAWAAFSALMLCFSWVAFSMLCSRGRHGAAEQLAEAEAAPGQVQRARSDGRPPAPTDDRSRSARSTWNPRRPCC